MSTINIGDQVYHIKAQKVLTVLKSNSYLFTCIDADGKKSICNRDNLLTEGLIIKTPFPGHVQTHFNKDHVYYSELNLMEYFQLHPDYKVVTMEEFEALHAAYFNRSFIPITKEQYDEDLGQMYPARWENLEPGVSIFFSGEATSGNFHGCCIYDKNNNTYWSGIKPITASKAELLEMYRKESVAPNLSA